MDSKRRRGRVGVDQRREVAALQHFRRDQVPMPLVASGMWGRLGVTKGVIGGRKGRSWPLSKGRRGRGLYLKQYRESRRSLPPTLALALGPHIYHLFLVVFWSHALLCQTCIQSMRRRGLNLNRSSQQYMVEIRDVEISADYIHGIVPLSLTNLQLSDSHRT
ncbi:hypothetical protein D5086_013365 [Populus alba]|uniref:Uncharacterized protein n=1 Tax=Populus alba TaxID=43335 RepID=A0ACC4C5F5_POPAL